MNGFYSIGSADKPLVKFQLKNLGDRIQHDISYSRSRQDGGGMGSSTYSEAVTSESYDGLFAYELSTIKPPHEVDNMLNYHLTYYLNRGGNQSTFIKQMRNTIVPYFKKYKYSEAHLGFLNDWIEENEHDNKNKKMGDLNISGNNNVVNNAGRDIHQSGITITVTENQYQQLKGFGVDENQISELKEIISSHSQDKPTFKSKVLKWLSAVSVSLVTKGVVDHLPQINEFAHNLIAGGSL